MQSVCITPPVAEKLQEGGEMVGGREEPSNSVQSVKIRCIAALNDPVFLETPEPFSPLFYLENPACKKDILLLTVKFNVGTSACLHQAHNLYQLTSYLHICKQYDYQ